MLVCYFYTNFFNTDFNKYAIFTQFFFYTDFNNFCVAIVKLKCVLILDFSVGYVLK